MEIVDLCEFAAADLVAACSCSFFLSPTFYFILFYSPRPCLTEQVLFYIIARNVISAEDRGTKEGRGGIKKEAIEAYEGKGGERIQLNCVR